MLKIINLANSKNVSACDFDFDRKTRYGGFWKILPERFIYKMSLFCESLKFVGELIIESLRTVCGRSKFRLKEFLLIVEQIGTDALPIVALISFLVG
jgi:ABC-type transporter Mla maintaining outer membrane lipid asymmetry permease subunit MlaE